jgi:hypothetical protein
MLTVRPILRPNHTPSGNTSFDIAAGETYRGQAGLAIGPSTCRTCAYVLDVRFKPGTTGQTARCGLFARMTQRTDGPRFPAAARACKHFMAIGSVTAAPNAAPPTTPDMFTPPTTTTDNALAPLNTIPPWYRYS